MLTVLSPCYNIDCKDILLNEGFQIDNVSIEIISRVKDTATG